MRAALRFLAKRFGSWSKLATAMGVKTGRIERAGNRPVTAGLALRAARVARVPIEDILAGRWPKPGMCPYCGRG